MNKTIIKLIVMILVICLIASYAFSVEAAKFDWGGEIGNADNGSDGSGAHNAAVNITGSLLTIFRIVAVGVAMIMLVVVAIKYMSAAPEGKAEIKKHAVIYIVGAIVLFASAGILKIIENFSTSNVK